MFVSSSVTRTVRDHFTQIARDKAASVIPHLWWKDVMHEEFTKSAKEIFDFCIESAKLEDEGVQGQSVSFDSRRYLSTSVVNRYKRKAFALTDADLTDLDSNKIKAGADWVEDITEDGLYQPQRGLVESLLGSITAYDGVAFFHATGHHVNGVNNSNGQFGNLINGSHAIGACPINGAIDTAIANYAKVVSFITSGIKDPSGKPRMMKVKAVLSGGELFPRLNQIIYGQFGPAAASSGGGTLDQLPLRNLGLGKPVLAPELGGNYAGGSATTYYVVAEWSGLNAPFVLSNREPFKLSTNSPDDDAELARINQWEWIYSGRQAVMPMHPYLVFKCTAT